MKRFILDSQSEDNKLKFIPLLPARPDPELPDQIVNATQLNSRIESVEIYNSELKYFDAQLLNPFVFKDIKSLLFMSVVSNVNIQNDLFASFKSLKELRFFIPNLALYIQNQDLSWSQSLNAHVKVDLNDVAQLESQESKERQFKLTMVNLGDTYDFPEEVYILKYKLYESRNK